VVRACLIDVYDTILESHFVQRMESMIQPLGIGLSDWLAEWEKMREDRDRGKLTVAASIARTLPVFGIEPDPALVADLSRRDVESARTQTQLCEDTVPFLGWLRSRDVLTALVSNCADTTRGQLEYLGLVPLVDAVTLSCEVGSIKPYQVLRRRRGGRHSPDPDRPRRGRRLRVTVEFSRHSFSVRRSVTAVTWCVQVSYHFRHYVSA
jgi:FMN phosphatase YigB (HAD superfamily)